jgi:hypothetical protein
MDHGAWACPMPAMADEVRGPYSWCAGTMTFAFRRGAGNQNADRSHLLRRLSFVYVPLRVERFGGLAQNAVEPFYRVRLYTDRPSVRGLLRPVACASRLGELHCVIGASSSVEQ